MQSIQIGISRLGGLGAPSDPQLIGAKAANLDWALRNGHPVPASIVLTNALLESMTDDSGKLKVDSLFRRTLELSLSEGVPGPWAVRSSGSAEDGTAQSFAGQFSTILDVKEMDGLLQAISECWDSRRSKQVQAYSSGTANKMAVIVQSMVSADVAGVAFSADPLTGDRHTVVINAVKGLGDQLVGGEITPEAVKVSASGIQREGKMHCFSDQQVRQVADLARRLEMEAGKPQDIEWAFQGGKLWLLQSRPVTSLPPQPIPVPVVVPPGFWQRDDHCNVVTEMGWDTWYKWYGKAMADTFRMFGAPVEEFKFARIGGNIYTQVKIEGDDGKPAPPAWVLWVVVRLLPSFRKCEKTAKSAWKRNLHREFINQWNAEWKIFFQDQIRSFDVPAFKKMTDQALLESLEKAMVLAEKGAEVHARLGAAHILTLGQFTLFCKKHLGWNDKKALELTSGHSKYTSEITEILNELMEMKSNGRADSGFANGKSALEDLPDLGKEIGQILDAHGLRILNYDLNSPTLGEKPNLLMQNLEAIAGQLQTGNVSMRAMDKNDLVQDAAKGIQDSSLRAHFLDLADWMKKGTQVRDENGIDTYAKPFGLLRMHLLELGRRIQGIQEVDDVFFLNRQELKMAVLHGMGAYAGEVEKRKGEYQWAKLNKGPKSFGKDAPPPPPGVFQPGLRQLFELIGWMDEMERVDDAAENPNDESSALKGNGVFAGTYTGTARVVSGPADFDHVLPGEVMVCRITTGEWSVVFSRVGALVTDEGGMLSHPAIIAREFRLPAVVGTGCATRRIRTGDRLLVDGSKGTVTIL